LKKQIEESINFDPKKLAEQLRKEQPWVATEVGHIAYQQAIL
jgi:hypothetical protein